MVFAWMMVACGRNHPQVEALFHQAEALMTEHPDSAYSLLSNFYEKEPLTKQETARYAVLLTRAANKSYQPIDEPPYDSLLNIALRQYKSATQDRAIALFYMGRVRMEQQRWQEAMPMLQEAHTLMLQHPEEKEYLRHILSSLSANYQVLGYEDEALQTTRELLVLCETDVDKSVALSQIGDYFNNKDMLDSAMVYQRQALDLALSAHEDNLASMYGHRIGYIYLSMERYEEALKWLNEPNHPVYLDGRVGEAFYHLGQRDSAYHHLLQYVNSDTQPKDIEAYRLLYQVEKERGELSQAYAFLETSVWLADSIAATLDRGANLDSLIMAHRTEMAAQAQKAKAAQERNWIIAFFIVVALLAFIAYQYRLRQKDHQLKESIDKLLEKDSIIIDNQQQIEEYSRSIAGLNQEKQLLQNWLFTQTPIYKKIEQLSKQDFTDPLKCKVLSYKERKELKSSLFDLCSAFVEETRLAHPRLEDDDILLLCLEKYTNFDANTVALCFGTTSKHTINQRRYRMKERF
jgi:tetratricopeptide (TPR) repeat protein